MKVCYLVLFLILLGSLGCVTMPAGLTSSSIPITSKDSYTVIGAVSASDAALGLFNFAIYPYSAYDALQKAKAKAGADGLINITCENKTYWLTLILGPIITWNKITVTGDAIKFKRGASKE